MGTGRYVIYSVVGLSEIQQFPILAVERAAHASKSLIIGLALVKKHLTVERAARAATVEVNSQIERWGEVEDSTFLSSAYRDLLSKMLCKPMMWIITILGGSLEVLRVY